MEQIKISVPKIKSSWTSVEINKNNAIIEAFTKTVFDILYPHIPAGWDKYVEIVFTESFCFIQKKNVRYKKNIKGAKLGGELVINDKIINAIASHFALEQDKIAKKGEAENTFNKIFDLVGHVLKKYFYCGYSIFVDRNTFSIQINFEMTCYYYCKILRDGTITEPTLGWSSSSFNVNSLSEAKKFIEQWHKPFADMMAYAEKVKAELPAEYFINKAPAK